MYPRPGFRVYYRDAIWNDDYGVFAGDGRGVGGIGRGLAGRSGNSRRTEHSAYDNETGRRRIT